MTEKFSMEQIREHWTRQATTFGRSPAASWSDQMVIEMEIREIVRRLADGDRLLDIGCANGYSTLAFAAQKRMKVRGLDYVPEMIEQARLRLSGVPDMKDRVEFSVGDILALNEPAGAYDKVVVIRVLINLDDWSSQLKGLRACGRVLKSGGLLLLSEATLQGWHRLNGFRREWGLPDIPMPPFNRYLDEEQVIEAVSPELRVVDVVNFSSTYYVGTRLIKPLLAQALGSHIDVADPNMEWNRWCAQLPAWGDYGVQKLFVLMKR